MGRGVMPLPFMKGDYVMSASGQTTHYGLPQYIGSDKINPMVDTNEAYRKIDNAIYQASQGGGGGGGEQFFIIHATNPGGQYVLDKSYNEIITAMGNDKIPVILAYNGDPFDNTEYEVFIYNNRDIYSDNLIFTRSAFDSNTGVICHYFEVSENDAVYSDGYQSVLERMEADTPIYDSSNTGVQPDGSYQYWWEADPGYSMDSVTNPAWDFRLSFVPVFPSTLYNKVCLCRFYLYDGVAGDHIDTRYCHIDGQGKLFYQGDIVMLDSDSYSGYDPITNLYVQISTIDGTNMEAPTRVNDASVRVFTLELTNH